MRFANHRGIDGKPENVVRRVGVTLCRQLHRHHQLLHLPALQRAGLRRACTATSLAGGVEQVGGDLGAVARGAGDQGIQRAAPAVQRVRLQGDVLDVH